MTHRRSISVQNSSPTLGLKNNIDFKQVPWLFLETTSLPRRRKKELFNNRQIPVEMTQRTFDSNHMFSNTAIGFSKQELNVINTASHRENVEMELHNEVSRVNLAKQIHTQSKIAFESLLQKQEEDAQQKKRQMEMFKDPSSEQLITPRTPKFEQGVKSNGSSVDPDNFRLKQSDEEIFSQLNTFDSSQMKKMILDSLTEEKKIKGSIFMQSEFFFSKNQNVQKKVSHGRRNIQKAIYETCDKDPSKIGEQLKLLPDPRDLNYPSMHRMRKFYGNQF
ncbi:hypothetical protein TVAG_094570 [Trichomonas vaginalis G3]|uniref:Uncharacterized protein n=1 Tax=Trichomonas vaginalis (strain ATCC PRA-98 / G3) TaxID=412133 RepID=A2DBS9_TRIV3|nr:hypothetical protein TVAGG3_0380620 [Trichomonas vaginalis G3]EAY22282.1 hypothetical protein TVAG_094570 [Trichomonas vaginalis G3]KAI5533247.1 hypothetical protein TVAGG3_0380620 [Trichomonas vaginalis G3]|eukprot:XP_001583268.1 hypothetical protein [Trichomonas vaginalis G3]